MTAVFVAALSRGLRTLVEGAPRGLLEAAYLVAPLLVAGAVHAPVIKFDLAPASRVRSTSAVPSTTAPSSGETRPGAGCCSCPASVS